MSSNKPFPSSDLDVFKENSLILDNFVNSQENEHPDRFARKRPTITGIIKEAFNVRTDISNMSETLIGQSRWDAVPKNTSLSLGGDNGALNKQAQALFNRTVMLKVHAREALRRTYQEAGYNLVEGSFEQGAVIASTTDVVLHEKTGKCFSGPIGSVPKGTEPNGEFIEKNHSIFRDEYALQTLSDLRAYTGSLFIIQLIETRATYYRDVSDNTSVDNSGTIVVDKAGRRWKITRPGKIDVTHWGVTPDGIKDTSIILPYIQGIGSGLVVYLPFVPGTINTYYFSTFNPSATVGIKFVVDPGVSVSLPSDAIVGDPNSITNYFSRETKLIFRTLNGSSYVAGGETYRPLSVVDSDNSKVSAIAPGTFFTPQKVAWPNSDVFEQDGFAFSDQDSALFQYSPGDGKFHIGSVRPRVGDRYSMPLPVNGNAFPCVLVRDQAGYSGVYFSSETASVCTVFRKNTGTTGTSAITQYPMQGNHASYSAVNSEIQLLVVSANRYDVLLNGFNISTITTAGPIETIGFGAFFPASSGTFAVNLLYPTVVRDYKSTGSRFLALGVFGDSRSSQRLECWTEKAKKIADGSAGMRLWNIYNHAVAGQTSAQQLAIMRSVDITSANIVVISVGTNDAQGQVGIPAYRANLEAMCDICVAANRPFIVVKPPLWYTRDQSGGAGQDSANYHLIAQYRAVCATVCANKGGKLVDLDSELGPIVSYYVNSSAAVNMVGKGDPIVFDNIHFTGMANDIMANAIVKAVMGIITLGHKDGYHTDWLTVKALSNWLIATNDNPLQISATTTGGVSLTGQVFKSTGSITDGTAIAKIPQILAPRFYTEWMVRGDMTNSKVSIDKDGLVKIYGVSTNNFVSLSGCGWSL